MATRSGSIDPGLLLYLLRRERYSVAHLERTLSEASDLRGISGQQSGDMREVIAAVTAAMLERRWPSPHSSILFAVRSER